MGWHPHCRLQRHTPTGRQYRRELGNLALQGKESIVDGGEFDGLSINYLTERHPAEILGSTVTERYGNRFPLLIKFLDSNADLSVQVHPDDTLAAERHNDSGKAELWYSIAPPKAHTTTPASRKSCPRSNSATR